MRTSMVNISNMIKAKDAKRVDSIVKKGNKNYRN